MGRSQLVTVNGPRLGGRSLRQAPRLGGLSAPLSGVCAIPRPPRIFFLSPRLSLRCQASGEVTGGTWAPWRVSVGLALLPGVSLTLCFPRCLVS